MASVEAFTSALHRLIDDLEDITLEAAERLIASLDDVDPRVWLRLAREGRLDALSQTLGVEVAKIVLPATEAAALEAATVLAGRNAAARIPTAGKHKLWGAQSARRVVVRTSSLLHDEMSTAQQRIQRIVEDIEPRTAADAARILERIRGEVIAPLREPGAWREAMNSTALTSGNEALGAASVRLADPRLDPDTAHQRALDAPHAWVSALVRTCPDCVGRHGQTDTAANWRRRGMPRSGWSVCRGSCRCQLIPSFEGGGLDVPSHAKLIEPLRRERMILVREGSPRGLTVAVPRELLREESHTLKGKQARADALREKYADDIRVRRAMRLLGNVNARNEGGE